MKQSVRPGFWWALAATLVVVVGGITLIQFVGQPMGEVCADSYSCIGFIVDGGECVQHDGVQYCTQYCDQDADCPSDWFCGSAQPTALTIETRMLDEVCLKRSIGTGQDLTP